MSELGTPPSLTVGSDGALFVERPRTSVPGVSVHAWFSHDELSLAPGASLTLPLTVHNLGDETESYTIVPAGLSASWTAISPGNLTLFGGSQDVIDVTVSPPALSSTTAGPTSIAIRIIPLGDSDDAVVAEATLVVEPFDDCRIVALQPIQRARHRATYEFMVENHGNTVASCRLHLVDPSERVDGDFDPPAVGVGPGAATLVRLKARAARGGFRRATRTLDFEVEAGRQGLPPVASPMSFVQSPTIPGAVLARVAAVVALVGAAVLAWFAVVQPAIDDAVAEQVERQIAVIDPAEPAQPGGAAIDSGTEPATTTAPVDNPTSETDGTSTLIRLSVDAALTQTADQSTTIADGGVFDMTDIRVENPYNDRGIATLLVNSEPLFIWSLENIRGSFFEPRITPIRLDPGDNLTFSVKCDEIGDTGRATCTNAVVILGRTIPDNAG
jgi:hypothetical protein